MASSRRPASVSATATRRGRTRCVREVLEQAQVRAGVHLAHPAEPDDADAQLRSSCHLRCSFREARRSGRLGPLRLERGDLLLQCPSHLGLRQLTLQLVAQRLELGAAGHHPDQLVERHLGPREVTHAASTTQQHEPVAHRVGVVRVVRDEDDAETTVAGRGDVLQHDAGLPDAERGGRLVEDQHARTEVHRAGDRHTLPLATRQGADRLLDVAQVDAHRLQLGLGDPLHRRRCRADAAVPIPW